MDIDYPSTTFDSIDNNFDSSNYVTSSKFISSIYMMNPFYAIQTLMIRNITDNYLLHFTILHPSLKVI